MCPVLQGQLWAPQPLAQATLRPTVQYTGSDVAQPGGWAHCPSSSHRCPWGGAAGSGVWCQVSAVPGHPPPGQSRRPAWATAASPRTWLAPGVQPGCAGWVGLHWEWEAHGAGTPGAPCFHPRQRGGSGKCDVRSEVELGHLPLLPPSRPSCRQTKALLFGGVWGKIQTSLSTPRPTFAAGSRCQMGNSCPPGGGGLLRAQPGPSFGRLQ